MTSTLLREGTSQLRMRIIITLPALMAGWTTLRTGWQISFGRLKPTLNIDIVSGFFEPKPETLFEESIGATLYPSLELVDWSRFLPSCRSVAFKKKVWEELGGFTEWLPRGIGEDAHLFLKAHKAGYRFASAPDATCYWRPRRNFAELFRQYFAYSRGAFVSGSGRTFMVGPYGANPIRLVSASGSDQNARNAKKGANDTKALIPEATARLAS